MRSATIAAAFVAGAIAVPHQKRGVVTDVDVVYVTDIVTVTGGAATSSVAVAPETTTATSTRSHYGHHWPFSWSSAWASTWTVESSSAEATSTDVAPSSSAAPSSYAAPSSSAAPVSSAESTSTYVAPTSSSAPSSTWAESSSSVASSTTSAAASASPTDYQGFVVYHHNLHRQNHSAPLIEWDDDLASTAATIASSCVYAHNVDTNGGGYGQNIAAV